MAFSMVMNAIPDQPASSSLAHVPTVSADHAEQIRRWHERAYRDGRAGTSASQTVDYLGLSIVVPPDVMPVTPVSHLLGEAVLAEARPQDKVLDMGTGSGINAILAASRGAHTVAVDINPHALDAARGNAERNHVSDLVEVRHSNVFSAVGEQFDLIIFDPPFRWFAPRDLLEAAMTDENYHAMTTFFRQARQHLMPGGRMLIFFGTSGDLGYLSRLISGAGFSAKVLARDELVRDGWTVEYFTFIVR